MDSLLLSCLIVQKNPNQEASIQIPKVFKQYNLKIFYPKMFSHIGSFFIAWPLFFQAIQLMDVPMISPKIIVECPGLSAKKFFKKENSLKMEESTQ